MASSTILFARVDSSLKRRAESVLRKLGVNPSQAINMHYAEIEFRESLAFQIPEKDRSQTIPSDEHYGAVMRRNDE
jgi:addiction module RelB/DinJ family antitoxin